MAADKLNQIGKYIGKTRENADRALKKQRPTRPSIERSRDIFDTEVPFTMQFEVTPNQKQITCDLEFNKPPPKQNCNTGGDIEAHCETFSTSAGDHEFSVSYPIRNRSVTIYVNGTTWPSSKWAVIDYGIINGSNGKVLVTNLTSTTNTVVICYVALFTSIFGGDAFFGLQASTDFGGGVLGYACNGTTETPGGWAPYVWVGPLIPIGYYTHYTGIQSTSDSDMIVTINMGAYLATVVGDLTVTIYIYVNGVEVGRTSQTHSGFGYWAPYFTLTLYEILLPAGGAVSIGSTGGPYPIGGWGNSGLGGSYLTVGRGIYG